MLVHFIAAEGSPETTPANNFPSPFPCKDMLLFCVQLVGMTLLLRFLSNATDYADEVDCMASLAMSAWTIISHALDVKQSSDLQEFTTSSAAQERFIFKSEVTTQSR